MNIFEKFKQKWESEKLDVNPPQDTLEIEKCFRRFGIEPSRELIDLYRTLDGKGCMDNEHFRLWSLKEILEENGSEQERDRTIMYGVLFADYCVNCWCYRVNGMGEVIVDYYSDEKEPEKRTDSVLSFFQLMEKDSDKALL